LAPAQALSGTHGLYVARAAEICAAIADILAHGSPLAGMQVDARQQAGGRFPWRNQTIFNPAVL